MSRNRKPFEGLAVENGITNMGNLLNGGVLARAMQYRKGRPLLFKADGTVLGLHSQEALLGLRIEPHDTIVVDPHGEIVPFVTLATRQEVIASRLLVHIDAHLDHDEHCVPDGKGGYVYDADKTDAEIEAFLSAETPEEARNAFKRLIAQAHGDISTFIVGMRALFDQIAAVIRSENLHIIRNYGPTPITQYRTIGTDMYVKNLESKRPVQEVVNDPNVGVGAFSIDADFCGCRREWRYNKSAEWFNKRMQLVTDILNTHFDATKANPKDEGKGTVYALSIDPEWCCFPTSFMSTFVAEFYQRVIANA